MKLPPSLSVVSERLCAQSLSELGLMLNLAASLLGGAAAAEVTASVLGMGIEHVEEWAWSEEDMERVWSGRLRKMEGENVSCLPPEDFSLERGDKKPELR